MYPVKEDELDDEWKAFMEKMKFEDQKKKE